MFSSTQMTGNTTLWSSRTVASKFCGPEEWKSDIENFAQEKGITYTAAESPLPLPIPSERLSIIEVANLKGRESELGVVITRDQSRDCKP